MSPQKYLLNYRLQQAKELLGSTDIFIKILPMLWDMKILLHFQKCSAMRPDILRLHIENIKPVLLKTNSTSLLRL